MQFTTLVLCVIAGSLAAARPAPATTSPTSCFPSDTQPGILNLQNEINIVINDIVQKNASLALDYSSTGRSLAFLEFAILPKGCKQGTLTNAKTQNEAIAALQNVQLTLSKLSLDAINGDCAAGKQDICAAVTGYGGVAAYVQTTRG